MCWNMYVSFSQVIDGERVLSLGMNQRLEKMKVWLRKEREQAGRGVYLNQFHYLHPPDPADPDRHAPANLHSASFAPSTRSVDVRLKRFVHVYIHRRTCVYMHEYVLLSTHSKQIRIHIHLRIHSRTRIQ